MKKSMNRYDTEHKIEIMRALPQGTERSSLWRRMPRWARRIFLIFCLGGILTLLVTDAVLLILNIMMYGTTPSAPHSHQTIAGEQPNILFQPATLPTAGKTSPHKAIRTPKLFAPTPVSLLVLSSSHLIFRTRVGHGSSLSQMIRFSPRKQAFSWLIVPGVPLPKWLHLSALRGTIPAGMAAPLAVSVLPQGLGPGSYAVPLLVKIVAAQNTVPGNIHETLLVTLQVSS